MISAVIFFAIGLVLLIKGGDWFVDGATGIAKRFNVPDLLIGATVVSIGTTLPEVMVSATSAVQGQSAIAYGNAIGSIICNTALIAALTIAVKPSEAPKKSLIKPVIFFFVAAVFYSIIAITTGYFNRITGVILLAIFIAYMIILVKQARAEMQGEADTEPAGDVVSYEDEKTGAKIEAMAGESIPESARPNMADKPASENTNKNAALIKDIILIIVGAALIAIGANLLVNNGTIIATELGVPQSVIALTFVALGTSLPELVTAIVSLIKGHGALSLGNIIGANLFNLVLVSGLAITLSPFHIPVEKTVAGMNASIVVDIPVMLLVMLILTIPTLIKGRLQRYQGILLLAIYAGYCVFQFV